MREAWDKLFEALRRLPCSLFRLHVFKAEYAMEVIEVNFPTQWETEQMWRDGHEVEQSRKRWDNECVYLWIWSIDV